MYDTDIEAQSVCVCEHHWLIDRLKPNSNNFPVCDTETAWMPFPSANGLFQFPAPTSGTVFHHTLHVHRRSRYSDSVSRHFSSTCHIRTWFSDFPPTSFWTLR